MLIKKNSGECMYNIYPDVFFLLNFVMNSLILKSAGWILRIPCSYGRMIISSAIGAFFNCIYLLLQLQIPGSSLITAFIMAYLAFKPYEVKEYTGYTMLLLFLAFCMEGAITWCGTSMGIIVVPIVSFWIGKKKKRQSQEMEVILTFKSKRKKMKGFYDSGNRLIEPITGRMVHIACYDDVKDLLPESYRQAAEHYFKTGFLENTKVTELQMYEFTFLSYHSIGNETGQLLGIRMDSAHFKSENGEKTEEKAVIGLTDQKLFVRGHSRMIINGRLEL